jgi:hypothetical protein
MRHQETGNKKNQKIYARADQRLLSDVRDFGSIFHRANDAIDVREVKCGVESS